jgi:diguanylate cyclase
MHLPRTVGLALGGVAVASALLERSAHPAIWAALGANALVWPHVAWWLGRRSLDPYRAELRSLMLDSAFGGAWIALMHFNLLPSVLLFAMLSMDKLAVGGGRFFLRCTASMALGCAAAALLAATPFEPHTGMSQVVGSLPLLVAYPLFVGVATFRLARRVREQNRNLSEISRTDSLSGLLNRRALEEAVATEFQRCERWSRTASLLMLDIDHFKAINDRHGHPAGDRVLRELSALLRATVRKPDVIGRYGGEEFAIVLPETALADAKVLAERVRRRVESLVSDPADPAIRFTVSIGIAEREGADADPSHWIARADRALYAAKANGRNRTAVQGSD